MQAKQVNTPLPYDTIKRLVEEQQWVKIYNKRTRVLLGLGEKNNEINQKTQEYLQEAVMPEVYKIIDAFLIKNSLSLVGYWDFSKYGATVVDKEQYLAFTQNERREAPKPNWEKFDELHKELEAFKKVQIIGSKNPQTGEPTWTVKSEISPELVAERAELLGLVEKVKSKFNEFDLNQAQLEKAQKVDDGEDIEETQPESENLTPDEPKTEDEEKTPEPQEETPSEPKQEENDTEKTQEDTDDTQKPQDQVEPEWKPEPEEAPGKETKE